MFGTWRIVHRSAAGTIGVLGLLHTSLTFVIYQSWNPEALWFAGTGLSLLFLSAANWSHVGLGPHVLLAAFLAQAVAGFVTLRAPSLQGGT